MAVVMNSKQVQRLQIKDHFRKALEKAQQTAASDEKKDGREAVEQHNEASKDAADVGARLAALHRKNQASDYRDLNEWEDDDDDDDDDKTNDDPQEDRQILFYESTKNGDNTPDVTTGYNNFVGVHAFEARQRITSYAGKIFHIPLKEPLNKRGEKQMRKWIMEQHRKKTPFDYFQMFGAGVLTKVGIGNVNDLAEMFCSEFVTASLQFAEAVDERVNASEQTPANVAAFSCYDPSKLVEIKNYIEKKGLPVKTTTAPSTASPPKSASSASTAPSASSSASSSSSSSQNSK